MSDGPDLYAELCEKYGTPPSQPLLQVPPPQFPTNPDRPPVDPEALLPRFRPEGPGGWSAPPRTVEEGGT